MLKKVAQHEVTENLTEYFGFAKVMKTMSSRGTLTSYIFVICCTTDKRENNMYVMFFDNLPN